MSDLNSKLLEDEFEIEHDEITIEEFKDVIKKANKVEEPTRVLTAVIEKAGLFLDKIERETGSGSMSASYMETAASLINSIIHASNSIAQNISLDLNDKMKYKRLEQADRRLDLTEQEIKLKELYYGKKLQIEENNTGDTNILVTDRESILKFLANKDQKVIEHKE